MTYSLLKLTLFCGLALSSTSLCAQPQFPMSVSDGHFTAPSLGVERLAVQGRSVSQHLAFPLSVSHAEYADPTRGDR
jgi:hypothetical protein